MACLYGELFELVSTASFTADKSYKAACFVELVQHRKHHEHRPDGGLVDAVREDDMYGCAGLVRVTIAEYEYSVELIRVLSLAL